MLTLRHPKPPQVQPPSRLGYRFRRFLMSKTWWGLTRLVLPILVIALIGFQIFTSQSIRDNVSQSQEAVKEWFAFLPGLKINELSIENATKLQQSQVLDALGISMPSSILLIDKDELRENLSSFDEVGDSSFRFGFNGTLFIELQPRVPVMIYYDGQNMMSIDHSGHRVEKLAARHDRDDLFVISGEGALDASEEALKIIQSLKPYSEKIRGLVRMGARRWDIVLVNNARLMLPADEPMHALSLILIQHQQNDVLNREIEAYDMRNPARPVLRLKPSAIEEMNAVNNDEETGLNV